MSHPYLPLLDVDLTAGTTQPLTIPEEIRKAWVGGTGLGLYLLSQELRPGLKATDPECPVYMLPGPLTGTIIPSSSDCALTTLNPDLPHHVCTAHAHGYFSARLRHAGWDGVVVRGRAAVPVYLWIDGEDVELRAAGDLWGTDTFEATRQLRAMAGDNAEEVSVACIGPAGENQVWGASVRVDAFSGFSTGGPGVVLGAKNFKGIAVRGKDAAPVHDVERLERLVARIAEENAESATRQPEWPFARRFLENEPVRFAWEPVLEQGALALTSMPMMAELGTIPGKNFTDTEIGIRFGERLAKDLKKWKVEPEAGWNCDIRCHHKTTCTTGPMAGATFTGLAAETMEEVGPNMGIEDPAIALMLCSVVDGYGMKAAGSPRVIAMLMEAFNAGEIGLADTDGIDLTWGNYEGVLQLLENTVQRRGLGDLIAQGFKQTATALGIEHRAVHMKWNGFQDYEQRAAPMFLFQSQIVSGADLASAMDVELSLAQGVKPEIGIHDALDPEDLSYVPEIAFKSARWQMFENSTGQCHFVARHTREPTVVEAVNAATGQDYTYEDAVCTGERLLVLVRLIQLYLGFSPDEDFVIAQRLLEKIPTGRAKGLGFTADELWQARDEYYRIAGFSTETGAPSPETLSRLGLEAVTIGVESKEQS